MEDKNVKVTEVGPRDGFQSEKKIIKTEDKVEISSNIYEFTIAVYLQDTPDSKALSETRFDRYKVIWKSENMGSLINERIEYDKELSEFLLQSGNLTIKSLVSTSGIIETQTYKIE